MDRVNSGMRDADYKPWWCIVWCNKQCSTCCLFLTKCRSSSILRWFIQGKLVPPAAIAFCSGKHALGIFVEMQKCYLVLQQCEMKFCKNFWLNKCNSVWNVECFEMQCSVLLVKRQFHIHVVVIVYKLWFSALFYINLKVRYIQINQFCLIFLKKALYWCSSYCPYIGK